MATRARLYFYRDLALVLARAADSGWHAHRALQLVLALREPLRLSRENAAEHDCVFAVIAPGERHRLRGDGVPTAHLFIDCGPRAFAAWQSKGHGPVAPNAELRGELQRLESQAAPALAAATARHWRQHSLPGFGAETLDPRIERAAQTVAADPTADHDHRQLAAAVHLSASRFAALFRDQLGMPVRNYLLWRRLLHAIEQLERGCSITEAAHASGFADAAHLSRSFRKVIGAAPSEVAFVGL